MQNWKKLGLIFSAKKNYSWMHSHASVPFVSNIDGNLITVFFSSRDEHQVSSICSLQFDINTCSVMGLSEQPILTKGDLGCFDDSGVMGCCILKNEGYHLLYYIGWNLGVTVPFRNSIGVAKSIDNGQHFERLFKGPILDRSQTEPHFVASNCVLKDKQIYKMWYLSCTEWVLGPTRKPMHKYHIKYTESENGINWNRQGQVAIDYKDKYEYAISVPRVIRDDDIYKMWFSSRGSKNHPTYRIRYAESIDGINWLRKDEQVNLQPSEHGWDSEMICYPYIFDHKGKRYILYNGNGYGKTGFGLAVLEVT